MVADAPVLIDQTGTVGRIRLNRPTALNSLTLDMVRLIDGALDRFENDPQVATILVTGEGDRAFCAGGDVRAIYDSLPSLDLAENFWRTEYVLNARIADFPKPFVAIMDGITMGGGIGVSAHGSHRIVTERTRIAMPECGIGFFPDVGATWLLSRTSGEIGTYIGLTGQIVGASDAIAAKLADACVPSARLAELIGALEALPTDADAARVTKTTGLFTQPPNITPLQENLHEIDHAFAGNSIDAILAALATADTDFTRQTRATLLTRSPTSLKVALRLLRLAQRSADLRTCLEREFIACHTVITKPDFREGIRAAVIDKDRNPRWQPPKLDQVTEADVAEFFSPTPEPLFAH
jgi:enoyl-CoA hydratase